MTSSIQPMNIHATNSVSSEKVTTEKSKLSWLQPHQGEEMLSVGGGSEVHQGHLSGELGDGALSQPISVSCLPRTLTAM